MTVNLESDGLNKFSTNAVNVNSTIGDEVSVHTLTLSASPLLILAPAARDAWGKYGAQGCVFINATNKRSVVKMMKKMWKLVCSNDVFFNEHDECKMFAPKDGKSYSMSMRVGKSSTLTLTPIIITDIDGYTYEGVRLMMGGEATVDLVSDEYELLYRTLKNMDVFLYSQALLNFYVGYKEKFDPSVGNKKPFNSSNSRAAQDARHEKEKDKEVVTATLKKLNNVSNEMFDSIGTVEPTA